jgi:glycosyltransferase involved in cell wall biosynthesis
MNFVFIITNLNAGGAEKAILNIASKLIEFGHGVDIILLNDLIKYPVNNIKIHPLTKYRSFMNGWLKKQWLIHKVACKWNKLNKLNPIDFTLSTLPFSDEIVQKAGIKKVYYRIANSLSAEIRQASLKNPKKALKRQKKYQKIYENQRLIAVSYGVRDDLEKIIQTTFPISTIYNPFDKDSIKKLSLLDIEPKRNGRSFALHVGRFVAQKRHDLLLDAWKIANLDMDLLLICEQNPELEKMIEERGLQDSVKIIGFQNNPYSYMRQSELLILSSDREGMPNVIVEALICKTRVVSTDCPHGVREIFKDKLEQFLAPTNQPYALAEKIHKALSLPKSYFNYPLTEFDIEESIKKYIALAQE